MTDYEEIDSGKSDLIFTAVVLLEILCLSACQPSNITPPTSGDPGSSSAFSSMVSENPKTTLENSDAPVSENESQDASEEPLTDEEEFVIIVPDKNLPGRTVLLKSPRMQTVQGGSHMDLPHRN